MKEREVKEQREDKEQRKDKEKIILRSQANWESMKIKSITQTKKKKKGKSI